MIDAMSEYATYQVSTSDREPLVAFMVEALEDAGCRVLHRPDPSTAPFRITLETPLGERMGIVAYAFLANSVLTRNRPADEHRFQVKYGSRTGTLQRIWQDPYQLYTTLFLGINPEVGFFVAADPMQHDPTRFFISVEFKEAQVQEILEHGWASWERAKRERAGEPEDERGIEVLVGGTKRHFLQLVRFERVAQGLDPGQRQLAAEKIHSGNLPKLVQGAQAEIVLPATVRHVLADEFALDEAQILDLIANAPRLKMAVRGWVAETHLYDQLCEVPGVEGLQKLEEEGAPDLRLRYRGSAPLLIECKNVLRKAGKNGEIRLDFQRTRASQADPCSRFYQPSDFDLVAACLQSRTESWEFRYAQPGALDPHKRCVGRLSNNVRLDDRWIASAEAALRAAVALRSD